MHAGLLVLRAADRIVDSIELEVHVSCCIVEYVRNSNKYILPPPKSPILTTNVEKCTLSNWPRRLCVGIRYSGALSSLATPSSHLTGLNSGSCKNRWLCVCPVVEIKIFAGWRSNWVSRWLPAWSMKCRLTAMNNAWLVKKVETQQELAGVILYVFCLVWNLSYCQCHSIRYHHGENKAQVVSVRTRMIEVIK